MWLCRDFIGSKTQKHKHNVYILVKSYKKVCGSE